MPGGVAGVPPIREVPYADGAGSGLGLQGLQGATQAAQAQGQLGAAEQQANLANLNAMSGLGATQRGISAEDVAAQKAAFEEARTNPFKMVQFQQSLLQGLPLAAQSYNVTQPSTLQQILAGIGGGTSLFGGRGVVLGTLVGALIVGVFRNGLTLMGVSSVYQILVTGILVILAVATDQLSRKGAR